MGKDHHLLSPSPDLQQPLLEGENTSRASQPIKKGTLADLQAGPGRAAVSCFTGFFGMS